MGMQNGTDDTATLNRVWQQFLRKLNTFLPYDPAIAAPGIYAKEVKTYVYTKPCTQMFTVALSIIAETWKQPRCLLVVE